MKVKLKWKICGIFVMVILCLAATAIWLYTPKKLKLNFDAAYYWSTKKFDDSTWSYREYATGHKYFLYLPEKYKNDKDNAKAKLPLIVTFHGSMEQAKAVSYARTFITPEFQKEVYPEGCAVLAVVARIGYFTDPHSMSLLIQNVLLQNLCIDPTNIVAWGFSQGAKYAVELACHEPHLFRGVISGSGFYQMSLKELLTVLPVSFYFATSENDKGIFEQGSPTGKMCGFWCRNSRYVQYKSRYHFWVELKDKTGHGEETAQDWIKAVVNRK
ncbi:MAG: hypothetical protein J6X11_02875 [Treponema sp.]|nr:hypothetical protein [Treponema sp.]MBR4385306.1 hypothetical protein [Treponema sp.]